MKIRVINQELSEFNHDYKVRNINYDMVVVEENNKTYSFVMEDIELISENKYDELILKYKDILKIKLGHNISVALYSALVNCIEGKIDGKLMSLNVLKDEYNVSKRGIWEKKLVVVVNQGVPLDITVIGEKYSERFSITLKDITLQDFIEGCSESIQHIRKDIEEKENAIKAFKRAVDEVLNNSVNVMDESVKKLVSGQ
jgi:hypothetical protein